VSKTAIKYQILDHCINQLQKTIDNIEYAMNDAQKSANDYGQPKDRYDSYRTQLLRKRDLLARQLKEAILQMEALGKVNPESMMSRVGFGAIVLTTNQNMFISVGLGKVHLDGKDFYVISPNVPIFEAMRDKKKGEEFEFRGMKQKIIDVF
jgi:hypothetical protein